MFLHVLPFSFFLKAKILKQEKDDFNSMQGIILQVKDTTYNDCLILW